MPETLLPASSAELRDALAAASSSSRQIELFGANSKRLMAGPIPSPAVQISTAGMRRILQYEPRDLTISVEAGIRLADLNAELARNGQMIPLDGPWGNEATVGGVVAANISGARRRLYGTARDLVIGMTFATLDGKLVQSGGMVVKNVAGLDMGKLMIGSFGTLAAMASLNFKLTPRPAVSRTLLFSFDDLKAATAARDAAIRGVLHPVAVDLLNPALSTQIGLSNFTVAIMLGGNPAVMERAVRDASAFGASQALAPEEEQSFWNALYEVTPRFLEKFPDAGSVVRVSTTLTECGEALGAINAPAHAHAGNGIVRGWFADPQAAAGWLSEAAARGWKGVVEFSSASLKSGMALWPKPENDFAIMKEIKRMFDPGNLLNRGRLYGQI